MALSDTDFDPASVQIPGTAAAAAPLTFSTGTSGYHPVSASDPNAKMEGGFLGAGEWHGKKFDKQEPLYTLDAYRRGKAPYVSVAMDNSTNNPLPYGTMLSSPDFEGIPFRVMDTGSAFNGKTTKYGPAKGLSRMDIARDTNQGANSPENNRSVTFQVVGQNQPPQVTKPSAPMSDTDFEPASVQLPTIKNTRSLSGSDFGQGSGQMTAAKSIPTLRDSDFTPDQVVPPNEEQQKQATVRAYLDTQQAIANSPAGFFAEAYSRGMRGMDLPRTPVQRMYEALGFPQSYVEKPEEPFIPSRKLSPEEQYPHSVSEAWQWAKEGVKDLNRMGAVQEEDGTGNPKLDEFIAGINSVAPHIDPVQPIEVQSWVNKLTSSDWWRGKASSDEPPVIKSPEIGSLANISSGLQRSAAKTFNFFVSPEGVALLGTSLLSEDAQHAVSAAFALQMAKQVPEQVVSLAQSKNSSEATERAADLVTSSGLMAMAAGHAVSESPGGSPRQPARPETPPARIPLSSIAGERNPLTPEEQSQFAGAPAAARPTVQPEPATDLEPQRNAMRSTLYTRQGYTIPALDSMSLEEMQTAIESRKPYQRPAPSEAVTLNDSDFEPSRVQIPESKGKAPLSDSDFEPASVQIPAGNKDVSGSSLVDSDFEPASVQLPKRDAVSSEEQQAIDEHQAEQAALLKEVQGEHGIDVMQAIADAGGLPHAGAENAGEYGGELTALTQSRLGARQAADDRSLYTNLFKADAPHPDELATRLRDRGIDVQTPDDVFQLANDVMRHGNTIVPDRMELRSRFNRESGGIPVSLFEDAVDFGKRIYQAGMNYLDWAGEMVRHLGGKVADYLKGVWQRMQSEEGSVGGGGGLNIKGERPEGRRGFNRDIGNYLQGTLPSETVLKLGTASDALQSAGLPKQPIELTQGVIKYAKDQHGVEPEHLVNLDAAVNDPIGVFNSETDPRHKVVLTGLESNGKPIVAVVRPDHQRGRNTVIDVRSIHPKDTSTGIAKWISSGDATYWNQEKGQAWLRRTFGADAPQWEAKLGTGKSSAGAMERQAASDPIQRIPPSYAPEGQRRKFIQSVKDIKVVAPTTRARIESIYEPITNKETVQSAKDRINAVGIDAALLEILQTNKNNPPTALTNATGIELIGRLDAVGRHEDSAQIVEHMAREATSQGQAIQALSLLARLTPQGIQFYAERLIRDAVSQDPTKLKNFQDLAEARTKILEAKHNEATRTVVDMKDIFKGVLPDKTKITALNLALRDVIKAGADKTAMVRVMIEHDIPVVAANRIAEAIVKGWKVRMRALQDQVLRNLQKVDAPGQRVKASAIEKLIALNKSGALDDAKFYEAIAKQYGIPVFTREMAVKIQGLQRQYEAATHPEMKLVKAAEMLDAVHELVPSNLWEKARALQSIAMLLNVKTVVKITVSHAAQLVVDTFIDSVNAGIVDPLVSVVTGKRSTVTPGLGQRMVGLTAPMKDLKLGYGAAREQGDGRGKAFMQGVKAMEVLAKLVNGGVVDPTDIKRANTHVFSSAFMRSLEDATSLAHWAPYRAFHQAAYLASLQNEMAVARRNGVEVVSPTKEMIDRSMYYASRAIFMDKNFVSTMAKGVQKALNLEKPFGIGSLSMPFTHVPGALVFRAGEMSPIGFIRTMYELVRPVAGKEFRQREFVDSFTRALTGTATIALGYYLAKMGIISGGQEENKDVEAMRKASGLGSHRLNVTALKRMLWSGNFHVPQQDQQGDLLASYGWLEPAAMPVAMGASWAHEEHKQNIAAKRGKIAELDMLFHAFNGGFEALNEQPMISGIMKLGRDVATGGPANAVMKIGSGALSNFVPTAVSQVNQYSNNILPETRAGGMMEHGMNQVLSKVQFLSKFGVPIKQFPPAYDALGHAAERYQYPQNTVLNIFFNPATITRVQADPIAREALSVYAHTGDATAVPHRVAPKITVNGKQVELTNQQISQYQQIVGGHTRQWMSGLVASPEFADAPAEVKARILATVLRNADTLAKFQMFQAVPRH